MGHNKAHELAAKDEHYTPKFIFEQLNVTFDIDVAAPRGGGGVDTSYEIL